MPRTSKVRAFEARVLERVEHAGYQHKVCARDDAQAYDLVLARLRGFGASPDALSVIVIGKALSLTLVQMTVSGLLPSTFPSTS